MRIPRVGCGAAIREPGKLADLGWFAPDSLPTPLTHAARAALSAPR